MSYSSLNEITQRCNSEGIPFWKAVQYSDMEEREVTEQASFQMMQKMWNPRVAAERLLILIGKLQKGEGTPFAEGPCSEA